MKRKVSAKHIETGQIGELLAGKYLEDRGHVILERNYRKKWGEIDIVSCETSKLHFVEVKTVSYETKQELDEAVTRRTRRPEENVHESKLKKLHRAIETWIQENKYQGDWQIDILSIRIVPREKYATVKLIPNVIC